MKTRLLLACFAIVMASCSTHDDSSGNGNPSENEGEKKLREIVQTEFNENGSVKLTSKTQFDDNDRSLFWFQYDGAGELTTRFEYTYNQAGQLQGMTSYAVQGSSETVDYSYTLTYDSNNRVITKEETSPVTASTTFTYNANNTVTVIRSTGSGADMYSTYYLNNNGQLFKKTTETETELLAYTGENILSYTNSTYSSSFTYDTTVTTKGQQQNVAINRYKGSKVNALMLEGLTAIDLGSTLYTSQKNDNNGDVYTYEYQFDNEGYPIKVRCFKNGASIPFFIREINYK